MQSEIFIRIQMAKRQVFQLAAHQPHAEPVSNWCIDIQRFPGDALLLFRRQKFQRAHVVQSVGQLDHHHAHIIDHRQQHLAQVFRLPRFGSHQVQPADLCYSLHQLRRIRAKQVCDALKRDLRVFHHVMQQRGRHGCYVQLHIRQDVRHFQRMGKERIAGLALLRAVLFRGELVRAAEHFRYCLTADSGAPSRSAR